MSLRPLRQSIPGTAPAVPMVGRVLTRGDHLALGRRLNRWTDALPEGSPALYHVRHLSGTTSLTVGLDLQTRRNER